jgi:hypothetical protein
VEDIEEDMEVVEVDNFDKDLVVEAYKYLIDHNLKEVVVEVDNLVVVEEGIVEVVGEDIVEVVVVGIVEVVVADIVEDNFLEDQGYMFENDEGNYFLLLVQENNLIGNHHY